MARVEFHKRPVDALGGILPNIGGVPSVACNDAVAVCLCGYSALLLVAFHSPASITLGVWLSLANDSDQRENLAAVFAITRIGRAGEFPVRQDGEVITGAVVSDSVAGADSRLALGERSSPDLLFDRR